jgi:hypothetical protein
MGTALSVIPRNTRTWLLRVLAVFFAGLTIIELFVLDLRNAHDISQLWIYASLAVFFGALQLPHANPFRKPVFILACVSLIADALYAFTA